MRKDKKPTEINLTAMDEGVFHYGQKVYMVDCMGTWGASAKTFTEKCPVCDDTRKINVRGFEFKCPYCDGAGRGNAISITIRGYRVREWIINQVDIVGEERKNAYCNKGSEDDLPHTRWYGFHRSDNSYGGISTRQFYTSEVCDEDPNEISPGEDVGRRVFLTKVSAEKYCRRVHEAQKAQLDRFNAEHGTAHEYPYEF